MKYSLGVVLMFEFQNELYYYSPDREKNPFYIKTISLKTRIQFYFFPYITTITAMFIYGIENSANFIGGIVLGTIYTFGSLLLLVLTPYIAYFFLVNKFIFKEWCSTKLYQDFNLALLTFIAIYVTSMGLFCLFEPLENMGNKVTFEMLGALIINYLCLQTQIFDASHFRE